MIAKVTVRTDINYLQIITGGLILKSKFPVLITNDIPVP